MKLIKGNKTCLITIAILLLGGLLCCSVHAAKCPDDKEKEEITCPDKHSNNPNKITFLFAHGLNGFPMEWQYFADRVKAQGFGVWRTQVKKEGHIHERGKQLAEFIKRAEQEACDKCAVKPKDRSVIVVGHSMGGLDIRYIVGQSQDGARGIYKNATDLFRSVYTIATPHLGDPNTCAAPGGIHDLCGHPQDRGKDSPMKRFNEMYPASDFSELDINFTALYYECKEKEEGEDGVVLLQSQKWLGAWENQEEAEEHLHNGGKGYHKTGDCSKRYGCKPELCQYEEIDWIMEQEGSRKELPKQAEIKFYEKNKCKGDCLGKINLNYSRIFCRNGETSCNLPIKNDEARSARLVKPKKGTIIYVYDSPDCHTDDDYTKIEVLKDMLQNVCVDSFEDKDCGSDDVEVTFHKKGKAINHLDGKISCVKIIVPKPY